MPKLVRLGIVKIDEQYGKIKLYKINKENDYAHALIMLHIKINESFIQKCIKSKKKGGFEDD